MKEQENKMGSQKLFPLIISMSLPPTISMLIQAMYNIVDSMFVAQIGTDALTAVSLAYPIQNIILAVAVGVGVGVNSYAARKLGEGNSKEATKIATHGMVLALIHYVLVVLIGVLLIKPFFALFTENAAVMDMGYDYTMIVTVFSFGIIVQICIEKILQATGNMIIPMLLQILGAVINIILDPILIYGWLGLPEMGVTGAAVATVIGQIIAMVCSIFVLLYKKQEVSIDFKGFKWNKNIIKEIYNMGIPSFFMISIGSVLVMGINFILTAFSELAVSLFGIYFKLQTFVYMPVNGMVQGTMPIMSYNYGAKNKSRLLNTLKISIMISVVITIIGTILFWAFPKEILSIFNSTDEMQAMGVETLKIISLSYLCGGVCYVFGCYFQAIGKGESSLLVTLLRQLIILLPLAFLFSKIWGLTGVWIAFPIVEGVTCAIAILIFKYYMARDSILKPEDDLNITIESNLANF